MNGMYENLMPQELLLQLNSLRKMLAQHRRAFARIILISQMAALSFVIAGSFLTIA